MLTIQGEHGSPLDGDDHLAVMRMRDTHLLGEMRHGACEDDPEVTAPYLHVCPDETGALDGVPIYVYGGVTSAEITRFDTDLETAMRLGFDFSVAASLAEYRDAHGRDEQTGVKLERGTMGFLDPDDRFEIGDPTHQPYDPAAEA